MIRITPLTAALWVTALWLVGVTVIAVSQLLAPDYNPDRFDLAIVVAVSANGAVATWIAGWRNFIHKLDQD